MAKKISSNDLKLIAGTSGGQLKTIQWHARNLTLRQFLTLHEYISVVNGIINDCKKPDGSIAVELIDFAFRMNVISSYAYVEMPEDIDNIYYIVYASDLFDNVYRYANSAQIDSIRNSVMTIAGGDSNAIQ